MADSNITKRALAAALKELMTEMTFDKIRVSDICDKCDMNRKSFYYHFKDKYDLVNWIFDTEFSEASANQSYESVISVEFLKCMCGYFYDNRNFYRKILKPGGQNYFLDHCRECLQPIFKSRLEEIMETEDIHGFYVGFFTDALICAITRWLLDKNCVPVDEFVFMLESVIQNTASYICKEKQQKRHED